MKRKKYTVEVGGNKFVVTKSAKTKIRVFLRKIIYMPKLPYSDYSIDMENSLRDILLEYLNEDKQIINEKDAKNAIGMLENSSHKRKWGLLDHIYIYIMASPLSPHNVKEFLRKYKKIFIVSLKLTLISGLLFWFFITIFAIINYSSMVKEDYLPGGPLNAVMQVNNTNINQYLYTNILNVSYIVIFLSIIIISFIKKTIHGKVLLVSAITVTIVYYFASYAILAHTPLQENSDKIYKLQACNSRITYFDIANTKNGSNQYYELLRNGWKMQALIPKDATYFTDEICKEYFLLQETYSNVNIMIMPIILNSDQQPIPFYYDNAGNNYTRMYYGWFVKGV